MNPLHTRTKSNRTALPPRAARGRSRVTALALAALLLLGAVPPARTSAQDATAQDDDATAGVKVKLYYFRDAAKIVTLLTTIANGTGDELKGLVVTQAADDEVILYGTKTKRNRARRIIASIDLPRPGINMEMWGIQITSRKPEKMAQVMPLIRAEIDRTQQAVRATYAELQRLTLQWITRDELDVAFRNVLVEDLAYNSSLDENRAPSLADILLRMVAAKEPGAKAAEIANRLDGWLRASPFRDYVEAMEKLGARSGGPSQRRPFERFFAVRGLQLGPSGEWADTDGRVGLYARQGRIGLLEFALYYGQLIHQPQRVDPYRLQQSADALNTRLQYATDAINADMQDLFVAPTLERIRVIVRGFKDVEYAQVGKVSVASLSGIATSITSKSINQFDVTPPLRLSELLATAKTLSDNVAGFVPNPAENVVGAMPLSQVIGLVGALGEDRTVWRELNAGVSVTVTPNVLRNMNSAELQVNLKTGDPVGSGTTQEGVPPLSRVSQHDVTTTVYVNALDFFDLSAFASQATLNGGRGYVPVVGPVWRGLFGEIPYAGKLFSWQRSPQTVFSESLILTNSFITPTAMGVAVLYPTELRDKDGNPVQYTDDTFKTQWKAVMSYESMTH